MTGAPAVAVRRAAKRYGRGDGEVAALRGVDLDVAAGTFTVVMGPSGSGKSTLLQCCAGLDRLTDGTVHVEGVDLGALGDDDLTRLRRDRIGFVFQAFNLLPMLTAEENVLLPLRLAGRRPDREWTARVVAAVGLGERLGHRPAELSGGQQQRVAVARALVTRPAIVFADEPTGNLDSRTGAEVLGFLRDAVDRFGATIVMVTHDPLAATTGDRVVFLADGRLVDELHRPTADQVLGRITRLGG